jgi:thiamine pyrophosphokinase
MAARGARTIVVVTGGDPLGDQALPPVPADAMVVAADSGVDHAHALGLVVHTAVGDFDSVTDAGLRAAAEAGAVVDRHPTAKDATDLELALDTARALGPSRIVVLGGHGGRLDHFLANALLLAAPALADIEVVAQMGAARVTVVRTEAVLEGRPGDLVSLLPAHGTALGVVTDGLLYPLHDEDLPAGTTRGVSNELTGTTASVRLRTGTLLAVQPGPAGPHLDHPPTP